MYVAKNRFITFEKGKVLIKDLNNTVMKELAPTAMDGRSVKVVDLFPATGKNILLTTATQLILFDTESERPIGEVAIANPRYVSWSSDHSNLAVFGKHNIVIANSKLEHITLVHETIKIKSGVWDASGVFIYTTLNHIKYCLINGDSGIIRTISDPLYVVRIKGNLIHCLNRQGQVQAISFDPTEYRFKLALISRDYDKVFHLIQTSNLMGQSIIGYLQRKGYPEIALQFVKDPKTRFDLALECGNVEVALEMAKQIDMEAYWGKLGEEAKKQGNQVILEFVYQKLKKFESLSFLYLITGSKPKLDKMLKIATARHDFNSRFQNAVFIGNYEDEIDILLESGQLSLAYLMAQTYGMGDLAAKILNQAGVEAPVLPNEANLLRAPHPVVRQTNANWPRVGGEDDLFEQSRLRAAQVAPPPVETVPEPVQEQQEFAEEGGDWGADPVVESEPAFEDEGEGWDLDADLELSDAVLSPTKSTASSIPVFKSRIASDYICRGDFNTGMEVNLVS